MIEYLLKLGRCIRILAQGCQSFAPHIGRVQTAKIIMVEVETVRRQFIAKSDLQPLHTVCGIALLQSG
jgi:hypothetical protein